MGAVQGRASIGHRHVDSAAVSASSLTLSANPVSSLSQNFLPQIAYSLDHASQVSASCLARTRYTCFPLPRTQWPPSWPYVARRSSLRIPHPHFGPRRPQFHTEESTPRGGDRFCAAGVENTVVRKIGKWSTEHGMVPYNHIDHHLLHSLSRHRHSLLAIQ